MVPFPLRMPSAICAASLVSFAPDAAICFRSALTSMISAFALSTVSAMATTARCTSAFISSIVSFTFLIVSPICCMRSAMSNGSLPAIVASGATGGAASVPVPIPR